MKIKKNKILLGIIGVLLVIVIIVSVAIINNNIELIESEKIAKEEEPQGDIESNNFYEKEKLNNAVYFFSIEKCINNYLNAIKLNDSAEIIDLLDEKFINENNLTKENVLSKIEKSYTFLAIDIYETKEDSLYSYIVKGVEDDEIYDKEKYYIFNLDLSNFTYKIKPLYNKNYNNVNDIKEDSNLQKIKENNHNAFEFLRLNKDEIALKYEEYYINLLKNNPQKAYELLEDKYKEVRFNNNYNNFLYYAIQMKNNNKLDTNITSVTQGLTNNKTSYYIKTEKDNRYLIIQNSPMDFTIELDEYSIITDSFKQKYKKASNVQKISTNVDKVMKMINTYDYIGLYNILDDSYKSSNFSSINDFINYISTTFYNSNIYEIKDIKTKSDNYIIEIKVYKDNEHNSEYNNVNIIIKLQKDTDFNISFE